MNRIERTIIGLGVAAVTVAGAYNIGYRRAAMRPVGLHVHDPKLAADLQQRYGSSRNSEDLEEWIVRDFFQDERNGVFVDVGANHHQERSNTYYLETALGWSGVAIEPQTQFADGYAKYRPRTTFVPLFVSDVSNQDAVFYVPAIGNHLTASTERAAAEHLGPAITETKVRTITLDDLLDHLQIAKVDFLNVDVELAEPQVLAGFSIERFRPRVICIEAHSQVRQPILDYMQRHSYELIGKYLGVDNDNFWFSAATIVQSTSQSHTVR